jgi:hypothetical protein
MLRFGAGLIKTPVYKSYPIRRIMTFHEFLVPSEEDWLDQLGLESVPFEDEETVTLVNLVDDGSHSLRLTYDTIGKSIRYLWHKDGAVILDIFREGATLLQIYNRKTETFLTTDFDIAGLAGSLTVHIAPEIRFDDRLLFA